MTRSWMVSMGTAALFGAAACRPAAAPSCAKSEDAVALAENPVTEATAPQKGEESGWVAHAFERCGVSAEFPGRTTRSTMDVQTPDGTRTVETQTSAPPGSDGTMAATCADVGVKDDNAATVLDVARDNVLAAIGGRLVEERPSIGGREIRVATRGREVRVRFIVVGTRMVSLAVAPVDAFSEACVTRFLNGVTELPRRGVAVQSRPDHDGSERRRGARAVSDGIASGAGVHRRGD